MKPWSIAIVAAEAAGAIQRRIGSMTRTVLAAENREVESTNIRPIQRIGGAQAVSPELAAGLPPSGGLSVDVVIYPAKSVSWPGWFFAALPARRIISSAPELSKLRGVSIPSAGSFRASLMCFEPLAQL